MEKIYAGMGFTKDQQARLYKLFPKKGDIFPKLYELLHQWGVDQLLPGMTQWFQQAQQKYPQYIGHEVELCIANKKNTTYEAIRDYRAQRATARHKGIPDHYFNEYLLVLVMQLAEQQNSVEVKEETD